ncbi:MAG: hypothetical protein AB7O24_31210 [Kofleriaceae bacterium]
MRNPTATNLALATIDAAELSTVTGGQNKSKKEKSLAEKIQDGGKKFMEEGSKWAGEVDKIIKGGKLGGGSIGPGLVSPGITAKAVNDLQPSSKA